MVIITDEEILDFLEIDDNTDEVDVVKFILSSVERDVQSYIGRNMELTNYTEYYDGKGSRYLFLDNKPIVDFTLLRVYNSKYRDTYGRYKYR